jgi:hypothetical protein
MLENGFMSDIENMVKEAAKDLVEQQTKPMKLEDLQENFLKKQVEGGKSLSDITTDFAKAKVTSDIINSDNEESEKFRKELAKEQKETLRQGFLKDKIGQQAETLTEKQKKAEAFYISFRPILEFDFSNLIHKKQKEENEVKTYKDRSYGIPLMVIMLMLFTVPYCGFSIILAFFNGLNAIFEGINTFGKIARTIATTVFIIFLLVLAIYCILLGVDKVFGTQIITKIGI